MMILNRKVDPQILASYGFKYNPEDQNWIHPREVWEYTKPGRKKPSVLILQDYDIGQQRYDDYWKVKMAIPSNYYWDNMPNVIYHLIKDEKHF